MYKIKTVFRYLSAIIILFVSVSDSQIVRYGGIDDACIRCICMEGCAITKAFWVDGGELTLPGDEYIGTDLAYHNCQHNLQCAQSTIRNYMNFYKRDCNGDGIISCFDYAAIHRLGPHACHLKPLPQNFLGQIRNCLSTWKLTKYPGVIRNVTPSSAWFILPTKKLLVLIFILLLFGNTFI